MSGPIDRPAPAPASAPAPVPASVPASAPACAPPPASHHRAPPAEAGSARREALIAAAALVLVAIVLTGIFRIVQDVSWRGVPKLFAAMLLVSCSFGAVMNLLYRVAWPRLARRAPGPLAQAAIHALLMGGGSLAGTELAVLLLRAAFGGSPERMRAGLLGIGFIASSVVVGLTLAAERMRQRSREAELRGRLLALQARTNPHFLFNSLNAVAALIAEDPARAERMVERLSDLYRHVLERSQAEWIRLADEVAAVRDYLEIEEIRLGPRLRFTVTSDEAALRALVPPMILQPLVENAVLHGVAGRAEGGSIRVTVTLVAGSLRLLVEDDGPGPGASTHRAGSGESLRDLRSRLHLAYGGRASLTVEAAPGGGCRVELALPAGEGSAAGSPS